MLESMRQLALQHLYNELGGTGDPECWYAALRQNAPEQLFPFLIEAARDSMAKNYYLLRPDPSDPEGAILEAREFNAAIHGCALPFVQSTGSQSPALGPVLKRSYNKDKGGGPSAKILASTLQAFSQIAEQAKPWSDYFAFTAALLRRPNLKWNGARLTGSSETPALMLAVEQIPERTTTFLSVLDTDGRLPGEREDYRAYLQTVLADEKYATSAIKPIGGEDALTGAHGTVYPNALSGAGINLSNVDRSGVFAGLLSDNAHKKFALSAASADLLYVFSFHLRQQFIGRVAGETALILPEYQAVDANRKNRFLQEFKQYVTNLERVNTIDAQEDDLAYYAQQGEVIASLSVIWASFGQKLEDVTGCISDILPSRLSVISQQISALPQSVVFPQVFLATLEPDVSFNFLYPLLKRPGGAKTKKLNTSARLAAVRRDIAECAYHGTRLPLESFWQEVLTTAREYLAEALAQQKSYGLTHEGIGKKEPYLTLAGFLRHLARWLYLARHLGLLEEELVNEPYTPHTETAALFFAAAQDTAGLNSLAKRYAFLIGALFGRLLSIQEARGVNAGANALTWLKRLDLTGHDLPELFNNTRGKLLEYENDTNDLVRGMTRARAVREVIEEIAHLGTRLGSDIALSSTDTAYFVLLGQALHRDVMPKKEGAA